MRSFFSHGNIVAFRQGDDAKINCTAVTGRVGFAVATLSTTALIRALLAIGKTVTVLEHTSTLLASTSQSGFFLEARVKGIGATANDVVNGNGPRPAGLGFGGGILASPAQANQFVADRAPLKALTVQFETVRIFALARDNGPRRSFLQQGAGTRRNLLLARRKNVCGNGRCQNLMGRTEGLAAFDVVILIAVVHDVARVAGMTFFGGNGHGRGQI